MMAQLIRKVRMRLWELAGYDFTCVHVPVNFLGHEPSPKTLTKEMFEHVLKNNQTNRIALEGYNGQVSVHTPAHRLFTPKFQLVQKKKRSRAPLKAVIVFTAASRLLTGQW